MLACVNKSIESVWAAAPFRFHFHFFLISAKLGGSVGVVPRELVGSSAFFLNLIFAAPFSILYFFSSTKLGGGVGVVVRDLVGQQRLEVNVGVSECPLDLKNIPSPSLPFPSPLSIFADHVPDLLQPEKKNTPHVHFLGLGPASRSGFTNFSGLLARHSSSREDILSQEKTF